MTPSKCGGTHHHILRFLRRYLVLKMHPNAGQGTGTTAEGEKKNMGKSLGGGLLDVDTLKNSLRV